MSSETANTMLVIVGVVGVLAALVSPFVAVSLFRRQAERQRDKEQRERDMVIARVEGKVDALTLQWQASESRRGDDQELAQRRYCEGNCPVHAEYQRARQLAEERGIYSGPTGRFQTVPEGGGG